MIGRDVTFIVKVVVQVGINVLAKNILTIAMVVKMSKNLEDSTIKELAEIARKINCIQDGCDPDCKYYKCSFTCSVIQQYCADYDWDNKKLEEELTSPL